MSDTLILGLSTLLVGLISPILIMVVKSKLEKQLSETHKLINSRMTELLEVTKIASAAEGKEAGKKEQKEETKNESK